MGLGGVSATLALMLAFAVGDDPTADRLYGRVLTDDGVVHEGFLRWDRNESSRFDFLDGGKRIPREYVREAESLDPEFAAEQRRRRSLVAFGVRITWEEDDDDALPVNAASIRYGHLSSIIPIDARSARLELRSGEDLVLRRTSTDLGAGMRGVVVEPAEGGEVIVRWGQLERVDFLPAPADARPVSRRIYGTLTTWSGLELTGYVAWDLDETLDSDVLDGRARGRSREIAFRDIAAIAWESDRSARVTLTTGDEVVLRGTNDVDRDNRGIEIADPAFGRVIVHWEDFASIRFTPPVASEAWPSFEPGAALAGTVYAVDGREISGEIRWDNDETQAWELLDGWNGDLEFDVEFGAIREIDKVAPDRVVVTLRDGRRFELEDTDDVDEANEGVFVKPEGRARRLVRWRDFDRVVFE